MARSFAITTPADSVRLDAKGHVEVFFTVTNTTRRPIRGRAKVKALIETKSEWLRIEGVTERDFASGDTQQFRVTFDRPVPPSPKTAAPLGDPTTADYSANWAEGGRGSKKISISTGCLISPGPRGRLYRRANGHGRNPGTRQP